MDTKSALTPQEALANLANVANQYLCNSQDRQALNESILVLDAVVKGNEIFQANPITAPNPKKAEEGNKTSEPSEKEPEPTEEPEGESPTTAPELLPEIDTSDRPF